MPKRISYFPDPVQEQLLKAIIFDGNEALLAWTAWRDSISVEDIDFASQRLLPLLHDKLSGLGVTHPDMNRYCSVARYAWLDYQLHLRTALTTLSSLSQDGVPAMPLKGLALGPLYYKHAHLRIRSDIDILVPLNDIHKATDNLCSNGWRWVAKRPFLTRSSLFTQHAATFSRERGPRIDLHWHISHECQAPELINSLWLHAQPLALGGFTTKTLSDTDHFFHTCIHGGRPNEVAPIRWVTDAAMILRHGTINWDRLLSQTRNFDVVQRMQRMLGYLHDVFRLPIPEPVLDALRIMKPSGLEQIHDAIIFSRAHQYIKTVIAHYASYRRNTRGRPHDRGFLRFYQEMIGAETYSQMVGHVIRRLLLRNHRKQSQ